MAEVVIANSWTGTDGRVYKGGERATVDAGTRRDLLLSGKARDVEPTPVVDVKKEGRK